MVERKAYRAHEVARILDVDVNSIYDMVRRGTIPAIRIGESGKGIRIPKRFVDDLLEGGIQDDPSSLVTD